MSEDNSSKEGAENTSNEVDAQGAERLEGAIDSIKVDADLVEANETADGGTPPEDGNDLSQEGEDSKIQAATEGSPYEDEEPEEVIVYEKSFPAGAFPGDTAAAQADICQEAGRHLFAKGDWATKVHKKEDGSIVHSIIQK